MRVDLPGHGGSPRSPSFEETARPSATPAGAAAYVGYSMGGRLCLRLALDRPDLVRALVLVAARPGSPTTPSGPPAATADEPLAADIERDGTPPFLAGGWPSRMFATAHARATTTSTPGSGQLRRTALAHRPARAGQGVQEPLWDRLGELAMPVLAVAGELDAKYAAIARAHGGRHRRRTPRS